MLLVLFALLTNAQPFTNGGQFYFDAGTPVLFGAGPQQSSGPSDFEIRQANRLVRASEATAIGDRAIFTLPPILLPDGLLSVPNPFGYNDFGNFAKASAASQNEHRWQLELRHYRATHPQMTWEDRNAIDDIILKRDSARNQKLRRFTSIIPTLPALPGGLGGIPDVFDLRSKELNLDLAHNSLFDARQDFREEPNHDNRVDLRNARDDVEQFGYRRDASKFSVLGNFGGSGVATLAPIFRKKASETQLDIGYRNLRAAWQDYYENPTEDNRLNVELANRFIDATEEEDQSNRADVYTRAALPSNVPGFIASLFASSLNSEQESRAWLRYDRLKRHILLRKRAQALQTDNSVADRMMGLASYGPTTRSNAP